MLARHSRLVELVGREITVELLFIGGVVDA